MISIHIRISEAMNTKLQAEKEYLGVSKASICRMALEEHLLSLSQKRGK